MATVRFDVQPPVFSEAVKWVLARLPLHHCVVFGSTAVQAFFGGNWQPNDLDICIDCDRLEEFNDIVTTFCKTAQAVAVPVGHFRFKVDVAKSCDGIPQAISVDFVYASRGRLALLKNMNASFNQFGWAAHNKSFIGTGPTPPTQVAEITYVPILEDIGTFVGKWADRGWSRINISPDENRAIMLLCTYMPEQSRVDRYYAERDLQSCSVSTFVETMQSRVYRLCAEQDS